jgi:sugar lactone lactonase YvrE
VSFADVPDVSESHAATPMRSEDTLPGPRTFGETEVVFRFHTQMPTGVAVADDGRIFACYPRWGDDVRFTVAELRDGEEIPYPSAELNLGGEESPQDHLVSVQSVVVDPRGRLWLLDTASIEMQPVIPGGPKLVCVDLASDEIAQIVPIPGDVALETTYLNDVRFDLRRGEAGMAFITDSGTDPDHPMGIIVVDLASGRSWRRLTGHATVRPELDHVAIIDGQPLDELLMGSDGIAISADGERLFYCPLASRRLYSVSIDALVDTSLDDDVVATTIVDHGQKGASDGLETDSQDRLYATNYEHGAVIRTSDRGETWEPVAHQPEMLFVDTLAVAADEHLYFTVNQLHLQDQYQDGRDLREPPYLLMRVPIGAGRLREG